MVYTIYKTTNLVNGNFYIGMHQTEDPNDNYLGSGLNITAAIKKYGKENFQKEILFTLETREEMIAKEKEIVTEEMINQEKCYNIAPGGTGGAIMMSWTEEQHQARAKKISETHKKRLQDPEELRKHGERVKKARADNPESTAKIIEGLAAKKRGKTYEEIYGAEKAAEFKKKLSVKTGPNSAKGNGTRGRTYEEIYGPEKAAEMRAARRASASKPRKKKQS